MDCSIGGYHLVDFVKTGKDTYKTDLYKYEKKLATVENWGDDFIDVVFEPLSEVESRSSFSYILNDMYELLLKLKGVVKEDGLAKSFLLSQYKATIGFVELLIDLNLLVETYHKVPNKTDADFYIVGSLGSSWFTREDAHKRKTYFWKFALTHDYNEAEKTLKAHAKYRYPLDGRLVSGAILSGEMNWNLTFDDYRELYNP